MFEESNTTLVDEIRWEQNKPTELVLLEDKQAVHESTWIHLKTYQSQLGNTIVLQVSIEV